MGMNSPAYYSNPDSKAAVTMRQWRLLATVKFDNSFFFSSRQVKLGEEGKDLTLGRGGAEEERQGESILMDQDPIVNMKPMSTSEPDVALENS